MNTNEELQENETNKKAAESFAVGARLYPLDWNEEVVKMLRGRFTHKLSRPSNELMLEREQEFEIEVPVSKSGEYTIPESIQEEVDAKYYERIKVAAEGYGEREIPTLHKATAFQGLFQREICVDENCDILGDEIVVIEEIGDGEDDGFFIRHVLKQPDEKELRKLKKIFSGAEIVPDKNGRKKFVIKNNLRAAMQGYAANMVRIEGVSVKGEKFSAEKRDDFLNNTSALIQRAVLKTMVQELTEGLLD